MAGEKSMSEQLARLAAQQEAIRDQMNKYADQMNEEGLKDGGQMSQMVKKMEETEKDLVNKKILQETLNRQQEILTHMLESEKAELKRGQEEKRQSTEAKNPKISNHFLNLQYKSTNAANNLDLLKTVEPSYNYFYKNKINWYFLKFE
jgi:seryl-tRNA synthetase